ncbi:Maf family protein [Evansella cellulosilytica]|uniref:dTTP/UTP pyrophosphatase n=1 Tax=Evansella cellulosilytica (strain ATCC 21833 / DSM 2522 / FERM P-1141 / JCM 9156 / N-4) TaxID=649639 RepID=E6TZM9_EVAC2|nr:Maf family protein [Evansella cellulosilytica]ADU31335.1 maf protein [Evansella cellulosilytica DSM 2522]
MKPFILASQSPRRKQLLEQVNLSFSIEASQVEEVIRNESTPEDIVISLARQKAEDVFFRNKNSVVLGSDTIVVIDGEVLGKPENEAMARHMLQRLSGRTHHVYTGVYMISEEQAEGFFVRSEVEFYTLTNEEIDTYIATGDPFDKAGSYGIQGVGAILVKKINGDFFAIMGLPIAKVVRALKKFHINVDHS